MRLYPETTANRNIPKDVFLVAETEAMSGEIITTYYIDREGNLQYCVDWIRISPQPTTMRHLYQLTGDTEQMITGRWQSWKVHRSVGKEMIDDRV